MDSTALLEELKAVRKGRGVNGRGVAEHVGPALRELCGIDPGEPAGPARAKLVSGLDGLAGALPEDLGLAARAALGLHPEAQQPFLTDRVQWLAERLDRDARTARRRVDLALESMAERATVAPPGPPPVPAPREAEEHRWFIRECRAVVRLDQPAPEAIDQRTVVALEDVEVLDALITIPREGAADPDLSVEVLYGATIESRERVTPTRFRYRLRLPRRLAAGQSHDYALLYRLPPNQPMRNHYVYTSLIRCDAFDLRIRFDPARLPDEVWRVAGTYPRDLDEGPSDREPVRPDGSGEVHLAFHHLRVGLGYGAQWTPTRP
jgi:hypothetical protein